MSEKVKVLSNEFITHDVVKIVAEKPANFIFTAGQAVDVAIDKPSWEEEKRPFTFTSLPAEQNIEFTIKTYPSHDGVTNQLRSVKPKDTLIIHDVFGDINYQGEGVFIAGGAGVTPFIAIFKDLEKQDKIGNNKLIFANKTKADIICSDYFTKILGKNFINVLSDEKVAGYEHGFITADIIKAHTDKNTKYFYLCGPDPMMEAMEKQLGTLGVSEDAIIKEGF